MSKKPKKAGAKAPQTERKSGSPKSDAKSKERPQVSGKAASLGAIETKVIPGPRKKRAEGAPKPRLQNHKVRSLWFQARVAWPKREAPIHCLVGERARVQKALLPSATPAQWDAVGPSNIGGRLTCVVCHPTNPQRIWAGAAGGGVWRSDDGG